MHHNALHVVAVYLRTLPESTSNQSQNNVSIVLDLGLIIPSEEWFILKTNIVKRQLRHNFFQLFFFKLGRVNCSLPDTRRLLDEYLPTQVFDFRRWTVEKSKMMERPSHFFHQRFESHKTYLIFLNSL